ncbi:LptA/OstA family protein [Erythrobacter alti]|uniref:LptA/OstA family protein n=1 Tax=Erythrobacter alti TaxID=1896145 RepID=UPI0030F480FF
MPLRKLALRGLCAGLLAGAVSAVGFGSVAGAQNIAGFNSNQPVSYAADRIELQDRQNRVILSGDVVIQQGDLRLTSARTTVAYTDAGTLRIQRIQASGGVVVTRGSERARGDVAVYDFNRRVIIMSGGVSINRAGDTLDGGRLVIDLNSGVSSVDGAGSRPANGQDAGRVSGTFAIPESGN